MTASTSRWSTAASSPRPAIPRRLPTRMLGRLAEDGAERDRAAARRRRRLRPRPVAGPRTAGPSPGAARAARRRPAALPAAGLGRGARAADRREHGAGAGLDRRRRLAAGAARELADGAALGAAAATAATSTTSRCRPRSSTAGCRWRPTCRRPPRRRPARYQAAFEELAGYSRILVLPGLVRRCRRRPAAPSWPPASSTRAAERITVLETAGGVGRDAAPGRRAAAAARPRRARE